MFREQDAVLGFSEFFKEYQNYVARMKAQHKRPISMLAYLVEMFQ